MRLCAESTDTPVVIYRLQLPGFTIINPQHNPAAHYALPVVRPYVYPGSNTSSASSVSDV